MLRLDNILGVAKNATPHLPIRHKKSENECRDVTSNGASALSNVAFSTRVSGNTSEKSGQCLLSKTVLISNKGC